jgi:hypothetical protein
MSKSEWYELYFSMQIQKKNVIDNISITICGVHFDVMNTANYKKLIIVKTKSKYKFRDCDI